MNEYISRELLMGQLQEVSHWCGYEDRYDEVVFREDIEDLPNADVVEVVHARWEWRGGVPWCGNCGEIMPGYSYDMSVDAGRYCTNCGAKMDG